MVRYLFILICAFLLSACSTQSVLTALESGGAEGAMDRAQADANAAGQESEISLPSNNPQPASGSSQPTPAHLAPVNPSSHPQPASPTKGMKCHEVAQKHCQELGDDSKECTYTYKKVCH